MIPKEKIYAIFQYIVTFLICAVILGLIMYLIEVLDQERLELKDCFAFENERIIETYDYTSYLREYCHYPRVCTCAVSSLWLLIFYLYALPFFVLYEVIRRKTVSEKYAYLCVLGEITVWSAIWYFNQDSISYKWFLVGNTYKFAAPMAIIMLTSRILPPQILKIVSIVFGTIYGLLYGALIVLMLPNFF